MSEAPILVWDYGAIGGILGAAFVRAGRQVLFVDRDPDHVAALNERWPASSSARSTRGAGAAQAALPEERLRVLRDRVLCVKAQDAAAAVGGCSPISHRRAVSSPRKTVSTSGSSPRRWGRSARSAAFVNFGADYIGGGLGHVRGTGRRRRGRARRCGDAAIEAPAGAAPPVRAGRIADPEHLGYLSSKLIFGALLFGTASPTSSSPMC